ncbi:uncharacterized protein FOMMEDRAFT_31532 [Fomitiporia mediterranea MF3/22]|uniref:uncharacterized protein n=1 Tax=Fomitiporia mediterranea (strain MF3/22) TaxID=694068 RepID=UPI00044083E1|nr:uncharacterized protein FOMMEDRAFT_31532 [Fomitiporia mediterranea MF3/22]EJC98974.1 hypothetical protein FOMMEDRAFT_31532 [Fomitiporia mediterranea MF3/22]
MVLDVSSLTLGRADLSTRPGGVLVHKTDYVRVTQYHYARITPDSPGRGVCTDHVASSTVVVLHCPTTRRTTLSHAPNFMYMSSFLPLVEWVIGGSGELEEWSEGEQNAFLEGRGTHPLPCLLEAYVLRGFAYAHRGAEKFNHAGWIKDFRMFFRTVAQARHISLHIEDSPRLLSAGALLVDKGTGKITHVELAPEVMPPPPNRMILKFENPEFAGQFTSAQEQQDLFMGALLNARYTPVPTPLRLQFDSQDYRLPHPLCDEARQLIRSKRLEEPAVAQSIIIRRFGLSEDWMFPNLGKSSPTSSNDRPELRVLRNLLASTALDRPCELCPLEATKTCGACRGAWYCGDAHQRRDWKFHKSWCRQHPYEEGKPLN